MILYESHNFNLDNPYTIIITTNLTWELHFHRAYECIYVLEGEIQCKIEHSDYLAKAGQLIFIMPNQLHSFLTQDFSRICILRFSPELIGHFHNTYLDRIPRISCFTFSQLSKPSEFPFNEKARPQNIYALKALLYKMCGELVAQTDFVPRSNSSGDLLIYNLLAYIDKHYAGECSLKAAAEECCCDYYHASKTFLKYTGISFVDYVNNLRVHKACYLIKNTDESFINISLSCGFSSLRSFNRNFLKYCSCTPSEYARKTSSHTNAPH